jgi:predicted ATPase/DNA-binding XRE family transcriptional regulator
MKPGASASFGSRLKTLREAAGFTQEELATIAGLSAHAVSALERGERKRPHAETVRALSAALDLSEPARDALMTSARAGPRPVADGDGAGAVPVPPTALLGREADLDRLRQWLTEPSVRLITLLGPGGVGKTRLAIELARVIAEPTTRVKFVPLASIRDPELAASAIGEVLGLTDVPAVDLARRAPAVCDRPTVLVLDNFEQIMDAVWIVADLLASAPALRVVVTSRAPLHIRGEREYPVGPLGVDVDPETTSPADLVQAPAVRLFVERARDANPDFRLTTSNGAAVSAICRRLDALPLAIELAAPWTKVLSVDDLLRRLTDDVLLSTAGPRDLPERQQTINSTVAWSYQLLAAGEQRAFRRLGALPGRFSLETAAATLAGCRDTAPSSTDALALTAALVDKSLLLRAESSVPSRPLFRMLETIRAYAAIELHLAGERDDTLECLAQYSVDESLRATLGLIGPQQMEWLDRVRDDLDGYRAAMQWLFERGRVVEAADIACKLMLFWVIRGHSIEALRWYEQMLLVQELPPVTEAKLLMGEALMRYTHGDAVAARTSLARAIALAAGAGDACQAAQIELLAGHVDHAAGAYGSARERFSSSLVVLRTMPIPWSLGSALCGLAKVELAENNPREAEALVDEAEIVLKDAGAWSLTLVQYIRAMLALQRGTPDLSIAILRQSLTLIRQLQDKFAFVYAVVPLAAAAVIKGDDAWAARILGARDAVTERTGATVVDTSVLALQAHAEREARTRLGPEQWARAYAAGRTSSIDALLREIDHVNGDRE